MRSRSPWKTVTEVTDSRRKDGGAQGVPRLCARQDGHDRRNAGTSCAMCAASRASSARATRPCPSRTTDFASLFEAHCARGIQPGDTVRLCGLFENFSGRMIVKINERTQTGNVLVLVYRAGDAVELDKNKVVRDECVVYVRARTPVDAVSSDPGRAFRKWEVNA